MSMRVLCLHPEASSALQFSRDFSLLEERLWKKHGIELVFVDGPLLDARIDNDIGETKDGGVRAIEPSGAGSGEDDPDEDRPSRRWYVKEMARRALPATAASASESSQPQPPSIQYSGLDASLLHLSQIWTRGGANSSIEDLGERFPFQGVMGIRQGADVAGLLPLLNHRHSHDEEEDEEGIEEKENHNQMKSMFEGLQFVIVIDGQDILGQQQEGEENEKEEDFYVGPHGIPSLHVISEKSPQIKGNNDKDEESMRQSSSKTLANKYGPNATIHHCNYGPSSSSSCPPSLSNILGKFLVSQKNKLFNNKHPSSSGTRKLISYQRQLMNVEQLATLTIAEEIQRNPPKALVAVIGPAPVTSPTSTENGKGGAKDDEIVVEGEGCKGHTEEELRQQKEQPQQQQRESQQQQTRAGGRNSVKQVDRAVGAWHGARRRGFGEEGGGAPCPEQFLLREEDR